MAVYEVSASDHPERIYHSFLVRCWREVDSGTNREQAWRFVLVQFDNGEKRRGFASLDELVEYFRQEILNTIT